MQLPPKMEQQAFPKLLLSSFIQQETTLFIYVASCVARRNTIINAPQATNVILLVVAQWGR